MGITGLIPFLEKSSRKTNISEFSGGTVAIDTYCWLHKGAFSCADKIIMGQATDANRQANRKRAAELIKIGKTNEGRNLLRRSLDVSHKMALEVMKVCQAQNVDCIVAPYEADAQLAYLNISGIADVIITEDSDLTLFGCKKLRSRKTNAWSDLMIAEHPSIWSKEYKIKQNKESQSIAPEKKENYLPAVIKSNKGKVGVIKTDFLKKEITPRKRTYEEAEMDTDMDDIINLYKETAREKTPPKSTSTASMKSPVNKASNKQGESAASPVLTQRRRSNPFRRTSLKLPERCRLRPTVIDSSAIQCSKFFAPKKIENDAAESMAVNVDDNDLKNNVKIMVENQKQVIIPETEDVEIDIPPVNPLERSVLVEDTQDISSLLNEYAVTDNDFDSELMNSSASVDENFESSYSTSENDSSDYSTVILTDSDTTVNEESNEPVLSSSKSNALFSKPAVGLITSNVIYFHYF
ncbi:unnamed protein product [Trichogramma brassicae]|uniref:Exonuclease 1 n=1 Tax=Trichogramma brassicae TaxID=86971 RepID=A0A6H5IEG5_9HYME|nr:unnamed protein product [Trichogramma brassicae]